MPFLVCSSTAAVLDSTENLLTRRHFENSDDGFVEMLAAVGEYPNRVWALEGANGMGRSIAQRLVGFDERVRSDEDFTARAKTLLERDREILDRLAK